MLQQVSLNSPIDSGSIPGYKLGGFHLLGPMASIQELEAQLQGLKKRQADSSAEFQKASKRLRRRGNGGECVREAHVAQLLHQAGVAQEAPKLAKGVVVQLLVLMELGGSCIDFVVGYVLGQGRPSRCRKHKLESWNTEVRRMITDGLQLLYLGVPLAMLVAVFDGSESEIASLCRYIIEYHLWRWLLDLNCRKGVKPDSSQVLAKACTLIPSQAPASVSEYLLSFFQNANNGGRARRKWIASFRQRWGVKPGLLEVGVDLEPGELQDKVTCSLQPRAPYDHPFCVPWSPFWFTILRILGSSLGDQNWTQKWDPYVEPT